MIKKFLDFSCVKPKFNIIISGGEPLLNSNFSEIFEYILSREPNEIVVTTNGTLITDKVIETFKKVTDCKLTVQVSLDSINEDEHNNIRGATFAYKKAIEGIKKLVDNGIFTSIRATVTPKSFNDMEAIVKNAILLGTRRVGLSTIVPVGRAAVLDKDLFFIGDSKLDFINKYKELREKYGDKIEVVTHEPQKACLNSNITLVDSEKWHFGGCTAGIGQMNMDYNGDITPCALLGVPITNLNQKSVEEAQYDYENSELIRDLLNKNYKGKCASCNYKNHCGGCRAIPYGLSDDPMGEDITCFLK